MQRRRKFLTKKEKEERKLYVKFIVRLLVATVIFITLHHLMLRAEYGAETAVKLSVITTVVLLVCAFIVTVSICINMFQKNKNNF